MSLRTEPKPHSHTESIHQLNCYYYSSSSPMGHKASGAPFTRMGAFGMPFMHITWVLEVLMLSPTWHICRACQFWIACQRGFLKDGQDHLKVKVFQLKKQCPLPLGLSAAVFVVTQSIASRKRIREMMHPVSLQTETECCSQGHYTHSTFQKTLPLWPGFLQRPSCLSLHSSSLLSLLFYRTVWLSQ